MAWIVSPSIVAAPDQPQSQVVPVSEIALDGVLVITRAMIPAPNYQDLRNVTSSTTI